MSFRQAGVILPPTSKRTPKKLTQIRVKKSDKQERTRFVMIVHSKKY